MRKLVSILLILSFSIFILPTKTFAQEETTTTVEAGLTTESPFYFLDRWLETIELFFTFDEDEKTEKRLEFAEERLAELEEIADEATEDEMDVLSEEYEEELDELEEEEGQSDEVKQRIREARERHIRVLERVRDNAPEQAQPALNRVIERARNRLEGIPTEDDLEDEIDDYDDVEEDEDMEDEEDEDTDYDDEEDEDEDETTTLREKVSNFFRGLGRRDREEDEDESLGRGDRPENTEEDDEDGDDDEDSEDEEEEEDEDSEDEDEDEE
jgi:hypothetical protein